MKFIAYCADYELSFFEGEYTRIADREILAYRYTNVDSENLAIAVCDNLYAVFQLSEIETEFDNENIVDKIHNICDFCRETQGLNSRHISQDTMRRINTYFLLNSVTPDNIHIPLGTSELNLNLKKTKFSNRVSDYWGVFINDNPLFYLNNEQHTDTIFRLINSDVYSYVLRRWKRIAH